MTRIHPAAPALIVQGAVLALAIGRAPVPVALAAGVAALALLLAWHGSLPSREVLVGAALTTAAVLLTARLPAVPGWLGAAAPIAAAAGYLLATSRFSLPRRRIRESVREPRRSS